MTTSREIYRTTLTQVGGMIFISLPNDEYIELNPEQARKLAARLFVLAAEAEGKEPPEVIVFGSGEPTDASGRDGARVRGGGAGA